MEFFATEILPKLGAKDQAQFIFPFAYTLPIYVAVMILEFRPVAEYNSPQSWSLPVNQQHHPIEDIAFSRLLKLVTTDPQPKLAIRVDSSTCKRPCWHPHGY